MPLFAHRDYDAPYSPCLHFCLPGGIIIATLYYDSEPVVGIDRDGEAVIGEPDTPSGWFFALNGDLHHVGLRCEDPEALDEATAEGLRMLYATHPTTVASSVDESVERLPWRPARRMGLGYDNR